MSAQPRTTHATQDQITIRAAQRGDLAACADIVNAWIDATDWMPRVHTPEVIAGFIRDAFGDREIWVAGDPVEAYLSVRPDVSQIGGLYCRHSGKGVGRALMDRAREVRDFVWLRTHAPNLRAQKFYLREGFVEVGRMMPDPPETVEEIQMDWRR
ncbi:MAG: GNAT family N-acetyltransferase [Pseudomonadota bacterium]